MITASTSMKLPNVSWPIESENDRGGSEFGGVSAVMWVGPVSSWAQYTMYFGPWGTCRNGGGTGKIARRRSPGPRRMASWATNAGMERDNAAESHGFALSRR
jgi:hypothetical protein